MKKVLLVLVVVSMTVLTGCIRPADYPGLAQIQTDEIAFLVDMTSDKTAVGKESVVQKKDISINGYWVRTGRFNYQGYWRPSAKVIVVSQAPCRLNWDKSEKTNTVRMVSRESSGFILPLIVNAYIANADDAQLYLKSFRPVINEKVNWEDIPQRDWYKYLKESAQPLETALNTVVFAKVQDQLSQLFVKTPIRYCEVLSKIYIPAVYDGISKEELRTKVIAAVPDREVQEIKFETDVLSIKKFVKDTYGISLLTLAPSDGILYDNDQVQAEIDGLAQGVMKSARLKQDEQNAKEELAIAQVRATRPSAHFENLRKEQEIENLRLMGISAANAVELRAKQPWPTNLVVQDLNMLGTLGVFQK